MYLLDSNILIYHLNGAAAVRSFFAGGGVKCISIISMVELLAKPSITSEQEVFLSKFFEEFQILPLDFSVAKKAAQFKRKYGLTFPDAVMAATAVIFDLLLVTNDRGFKKVSEVRTLAL